ncbi:MAG: thioredoxin [Bdellovibrio sp.]|nr:thioredoxin [Bdellovibrio sp.]
MAVLEITKQNIKETIQNNELVILDFWASWCGPCRRFAPIFETVAIKHPGVVFGKVDTEAEQELAAQFEVMSIPTIAVIKDGDIIFVQPGALSENVFEQVVEKAKEVDMEEVRRQNP